MVAEEFVHTRTPKTVKLQDPLPSSELTPIEDSSDFSPPPVPQSTKGASKRKVGEGSEAEGRSKRQKAPLSDSSSVEISEIMPAPKPSGKSKTKAAGTAGVPTASVPSKTRKQPKRTTKSKQIVDSDDEIKGIEGAQRVKQEHEEAIGE